MPDGERVTTGSEPRRFTIHLLEEQTATGHNAIVDGPPVAPTTRPVEVVELEPGHDEQTEAALDRLDAHIERANAVWQPTEGLLAVANQAGVSIHNAEGPFLRLTLDEAVGFCCSHRRSVRTAPETRTV